MANYRLLIIVIVVSADAGMQAGHSSWVLNGCKTVMRDFLARNMPLGLNGEQIDLLWSVFVTLRIIGQILGAEMARPIVDRYGRRFCLRLNSMNFILSNLLQCIAGYVGSVYLLSLGRVLQCAGVGVAQISLSIFITEISPVECRGRNASFYNIFIGLGSVLTILFANSNLLGAATNWPLIMLLPLLTSISHFALSWILPESPKYLVGLRNRIESGEKSLNFYCNGSGKIDDLINSINAEQQKSSLGKPSVRKLLQNEQLRSSMLIMLVVSTARALSGYHVMFSYSTFAIEQAGMPSHYAQWATLVVATLRFILSLPLSCLVESVGRRPLMIWTCWGTLGCFVMLLCGTLLHEHSAAADNGAIPWGAALALAAELIWPLTYNFGIGPIPRFIVAEIFPQTDRALAQKLSVQWDCAVSFLFTFAYLPGFHRVGGWVYLIIILPLIPLSTFISFNMPETKNKDIATILDEIGGRKKHLDQRSLLGSDTDSDSEDVFSKT